MQSMSAETAIAMGAAPALPTQAAAQMEAIVRAAETALEVRRRYQFFVWSQSNLQVLLPHHLIVCGAYSRQHRELRYEVFNSLVLPGLVLEALVEGRGPLMQLMQGQWIDQRGKPLRLEVSSLEGAALEPLREALQQAGYQDLLVHGVARPQRPSELESFFILSSSGRASDAAQRAMLELLMPHLHATWLRVQTVEREFGEPARSPSPRAVDPSGITERERQILGWLREGMNNQQIGEVLGISALTVKNHVRKILRKLHAANRAQAVARAMSMQLLGPMSGDSALP
ncbi:UNVERIFIED_ORG: LuxR C-terminal-related transcriptional regulator [Shinella sp. XGS7]|nr:helix-turn-helix transcriptional regulator [Shinella sp. XGS7]